MRTKIRKASHPFGPAAFSRGHIQRMERKTNKSSSSNSTNMDAQSLLFDLTRPEAKALVGNHGYLLKVWNGNVRKLIKAIASNSATGINKALKILNKVANKMENLAEAGIPNLDPTNPDHAPLLDAIGWVLAKIGYFRRWDATNGNPGIGK